LTFHERKMLVLLSTHPNDASSNNLDTRAHPKVTLAFPGVNL